MSDDAVCKTCGAHSGAKPPRGRSQARVLDAVAAVRHMLPVWSPAFSRHLLHCLTTRKKGRVNAILQTCPFRVPLVKQASRSRHVLGELEQFGRQGGLAGIILPGGR